VDIASEIHSRKAKANVAVINRFDRRAIPVQTRENKEWAPLIDLDFYGAKNFDLAVEGLTSPGQLYQHLADFGLAEGRPFSPWVDLEYYIDQNSDLKANFGNNTVKAFEHLQTFGLDEGRDFSPNLDLSFYLEHNLDLSAIFGEHARSAFEHLQLLGIREGRVFLPEMICTWRTYIYPMETAPLKNVPCSLYGMNSMGIW